MASGVQTLRQYIRLLVEAAVSTQRAASEGLALCKQGNALVLYNPSHYAEFLKDNRVSDVTGESGGVIGFIKLAPGDSSSCWGAAEVAASAAKKGYGPLLYDIAMSLSPAPLMADRSNLSPKAAAIWQYYDTKRPDVKKMPFDDIDNPKTPNDKDDCKLWDCGEQKPESDDVDTGWDDEEEAPEQCAVNKAYTGAHVDAETLIANHHKFTKSINDGAMFEKAIVKAAEGFFDEMYAG